MQIEFIGLFCHRLLLDLRDQPYPFVESLYMPFKPEGPLLMLPLQRLKLNHNLLILYFYARNNPQGDHRVVRWIIGVCELHLRRLQGVGQEMVDGANLYQHKLAALPEQLRLIDGIDH